MCSNILIMTHTYSVSGMTCSSCQAKVQELLSKVTGVKHVSIDLAKAEAAIEMYKHIDTGELKEALRNYPKYQLTEVLQQQPVEFSFPEADGSKTWIETYKPILLIFAYITGTSLMIEWMNGTFNPMRWMNHFMAGFFLVFSFFKLLNLKGFAESYSMYDIVAKKWNGWGYIYAFTELVLGIAFLAGFNPLLTNSITIVIMTVSIIGVLRSVLNKRTIKCACLGDVFNLPMSTITIMEDALMIVMSGVMLLAIFME